MAHICQVHPYEAAEGLCRTCGGPFCADCLVYPFGPAQPPFCVPCAVSAGGVRKTARNRTVVVPKENKARLKEWRKARKRDLASPPPDGVATWQKMDEADSADEEAAARAMAAAEREALRLPPPEPETPTPPPGVNLAPPGPAGSDWRDEIEAPVVTNFGPPGSSFDHSAVAEPDPDALGLGIGIDAGFAPAVDEPGWAPPTPEAFLPGGDGMGPDELAATHRDPYAGPAAAAPAPFDSTPYDTYAGPAADRGPLDPTPFDPAPFPADAADPTPFEPAPFPAGAAEPTPFEPAPFDLAPFETVPFEPTPNEPALQPVTADLAADPLAGAFGLPEPTPNEPPLQPVTADLAADPLAGAFGLPEPTPNEPPLQPVTADLAADPLAGAFGLPEPTPADPLAAFGLGGPATGAAAPGSESAPFDPLPPPPAPADSERFADLGPPVATAFAPLPPPPASPPPMRSTPSTPSTRPEPTSPRRPTPPHRPDLAGIRPPTPTRIPAAKAEEKGSDAKAMLARIAALRSDKDG